MRSPSRFPSWIPGQPPVNRACGRRRAAARRALSPPRVKLLRRRVAGEGTVSNDSAPGTDAAIGQARRINWGAVARILIVALIVPELIYFSIDIAVIDGSRGWWLFLVQHHRFFAGVFSTSAIAAVIFGWESFRRLIGEELRGPVEDPATRAAFLALHLA